MRKPGPARRTMPVTAVTILTLLFAAAPSRAETFTPDAGLTFFNDTVPALQERYHVPGTGVALVHKGKTVFLGGYGQADLENRIHVNPKHTVFRCGSISKLFTVTAVMGLYERKLLDPGKNVNLYLRKMKIDDTFPEPVTLEHLMTHTAGFDERFTGIASMDEKSSLSLSAYLDRRIPPRVTPPGKFIQYSNHGLALAGLIVEDVSGTDFSEYITKTVFTPLGMNDSSFDMPARLMERCAAGYEYRDGRQVRVPFDSLLQMAPAGSLISTPADMAKFMIMHLNAGGQGGRRVLSARSAAVIQRRHFSHHPAMDGVCYDFFESTLNGRRGLYHTSSWQGCSAILYLIPGSDLGIFIAANARSHAFLFDLVREFHDRFYPETYAAPAARAGLPDSAALLSGTYRDIQYSRNTVEKIASLMGRAKVKKAAAGTIEIMFPSEGENPSRWVEVDERLYQRTDRRELVYFDGAGSEPPSRMMKGAFVYERVSRHETAPVQAALFVLSLAFSAAVAAGLPLFVRRLQKRNPGGDVLSNIPGHYLVIITANGWLSLVGLGGLLLSFVLMNPFVFTRGMPVIFTAFLAMLTVGALLTLVQGFYLMKLWKNVSDRPRWEWILPLITFLFVLNALFLSSWNLLGLKM